MGSAVKPIPPPAGTPIPAARPIDQAAAPIGELDRAPPTSPRPRRVHASRRSELAQEVERHFALYARLRLPPGNLGLDTHLARRCQPTLAFRARLLAWLCEQSANLQ